MATIIEEGNGRFRMRGAVTTVEATRFYRGKGSGVSGWVVRDLFDAHRYSDPIPNRKGAVETATKIADGPQPETAA